MPTALDLSVASRVFWVAACAGIIVFGSLMASAFVGQQFLQNVLNYSTISSGAAILPAVRLMVIVAPRSAKLIESHGSRFTLLCGYVFCLLGFLTMLLLWKENIPYWKVGLAYGFAGIGVGFADEVLFTGSVPVRRVGMASGTAAGARPGRRDHAVDPRGAAHRRVRGRVRRGHRPRIPTRTRSPTAWPRSSRSPSTGRRRRPAVPEVRHADHRGSQERVLAGRSSGPTLRAHRRAVGGGVGLPHVPEEGRGGRAGAALSRRGHTARDLERR